MGNDSVLGVNAHRKPGSPTLHDVAARAGVSLMTASRALSGSHNVRAENRKLVVDAARALGYRRNENARSLRPGQRTGLVGVIITNASNPYYADVELGVEQVLARHDMRMLVGNTGEDVSRERRLVADFVGWNVDGLIVVPATNEYAHLAAVSAMDTPLVLAARSIEGLAADTVLIDDIGGTRAAVQVLLDEGHRRVAFLGCGMSVPTSTRRLKGFQDAHAEARVSIEPRLICSGTPEPFAALHAARTLLHLADPPTAIFCANNRNTVALMHALTEDKTYRIPPQVRVVAFDNFDTADLMPIHLSVVDHNAHELGVRAAELLVRRVQGDRGALQRIELGTYFRR